MVMTPYKVRKRLGNINLNEYIRSLNELLYNHHMTVAVVIVNKRKQGAVKEIYKHTIRTQCQTCFEVYPKKPNSRTVIRICCGKKTDYLLPPDPQIIDQLTVFNGYEK